jgi:hypothetical protein
MFVPATDYDDDAAGALRRWRLEYARRLVAEARWLRTTGGHPGLVAYHLTDAAESRRLAGQS